MTDALKETLRKLQEYIDLHYRPEAEEAAIPEPQTDSAAQVSETAAKYSAGGVSGPLRRFGNFAARKAVLDDSACARRLGEMIDQLDVSFSVALTGLIDRAGITDAECYRRAQLNRSHFNRIKNDPSYNVQKDTVLALALALHLDEKAAESFLKKAGYALSYSNYKDLIVRYCLQDKIYDINDVNLLLYEFEQSLLGAGCRS